MGKKDRKTCSQTDDLEVSFKKVVPKLEALFSVHKEIEAGYQKYRKNGGAAIPGLEKHLGAKKVETSTAPKAEKTTAVSEPAVPEKLKTAETPDKAAPAKKSAKKSKSKG
jgi:hypothetical protein